MEQYNKNPAKYIKSINCKWDFNVISYTVRPFDHYNFDSKTGIKFIGADKCSWVKSYIRGNILQHCKYRNLIKFEILPYHQNGSNKFFQKRFKIFHYLNKYLFFGACITESRQKKVKFQKEIVNKIPRRIFAEFLYSIAGFQKQRFARNIENLKFFRTKCV